MSKYIIKTIEFYQNRISNLFEVQGVKCKFYPSCSEYMKQAVKKYGSIKGVLLGIVRLLKCNPFSKGGYDPLK